MPSIVMEILFIVVAMVIALLLVLGVTGALTDTINGLGLRGTPKINKIYDTAVSIERVELSTGTAYSDLYRVTSMPYVKGIEPVDFTVKFDLNLSQNAATQCDNGWTKSGQYCVNGTEKILGFRKFFVKIESIQDNTDFDDCETAPVVISPGSIRSFVSTGCKTKSGTGLRLKPGWSGPVNVKMTVYDFGGITPISTGYGSFTAYIRLSTFEHDSTFICSASECMAKGSIQSAGSDSLTQACSSIDKDRPLYLANNMEEITLGSGANNILTENGHECPSISFNKECSLQDKGATICPKNTDTGETFLPGEKFIIQKRTGFFLTAACISRNLGDCQI